MIPLFQDISRFSKQLKLHSFVSNAVHDSVVINDDSFVEVIADIVLLQEKVLQLCGGHLGASPSSLLQLKTLVGLLLKA